MKKALFIDLERKTEYEFDKGILTKKTAILAKDDFLISFNKITGDEIYRLDKNIGHEFFFLKNGILVRKDNLYGLYSYDGECILPVEYDEIRLRKKLGYLRRKGKFYTYSYENSEIEEI